MWAATSYTPQLPSHITGFSTQPDGSQAVYFTAASTQNGGPAFRVQATKVKLKLRGHRSTEGHQRGGRADRRHHQHLAHAPAH